MRRFEFVAGTSNKFWEVEQVDTDLNLRWGRIGTNGQSQTKSFGSAAAAATAMTKLITDKTTKGYAESAASTAAAAATAPRPAAPTAPGPTPPAPTAPIAPSVPAPPAAPAVRPAAAAPPGTVPPWLVDGDPIDVPETTLRYCLPSRRFPGQAPDLDPNSDWLAARDIILERFSEIDLDSSEPRVRPAFREAWDLLQSDRREASAEALVIITAITTASHWSNSSSDPSRRWIRCLVGIQGLPAAASTLIAAYRLQAKSEWLGRGNSGRRFGLAIATADPDIEMFGTYGPFTGAESELRRHLAAASTQDYDTCVALIRSALPTLAPGRQAGLVSALPDLPELANELIHRTVGTTPARAPQWVHWLQPVATDPAALALARRVRTSDYYFGFYDRVDWVSTLVRERGLAAVDVLQEYAASETTGEVLTAIGTPAAITALADVASSSKDALARLTHAVNRWPLAATAALAQVVADGGKTASLVRPSLITLLREQPDRAESVRPWVTPAAAATMAAVAAQLAGPSETATLEELPAVLISPPWLARRAKTQPVIVDPLPLAPIERWEPGAREAVRQQVDWSSASPEELAASFNSWWDKADREAVPRAVRSAAVAAIKRRDVAGLIDAWNATLALPMKHGWYRSSTIRGHSLATWPQPFGVDVWNQLAGTTEADAGISEIVARCGLAALPGLCAVLRRRPAEFAADALALGSVELAPILARGFAKLKSVREVARTWLLRYPDHTAAALIAPAIGKPGEARDCAVAALQLLDSAGQGELIRRVAQRYGLPAVDAAVELMLNEGPLDRFPTKRPALPVFWQPTAWRRPVLLNGKALPADVLDHLGTMFAFPTSEGTYAGIEEVKQACTPQSLADFGWDLFGSWLYHGAPSKDSWAMTVLSQIGTDVTARDLTPYLRAWPGEAQHKRAVSGLDVLAGIGTDVALMMLNGIAQKVKFKGLQDRAVEKIDEIAEARGLTPEELADRLTPDLDLDPDGTLLLDFGPRQFRVGFDEALKPYVRDGDGARLADLPKPRATDDREVATASVQRFKLLKKDVRTIAGQQVLRLEVAMCLRRRWTVEVFTEFLAGHPLVRHLVQRLVWGVYDSSEGTGPYGRLLSCFRVAEDGSLTDAEDEPFDLPAGERILLGIPHALELSPEVTAAFGQLLADYELLQPFVQLGRDTYRLTEDERQSVTLRRWSAFEVPTGKVLGLANKGWRRGMPQDGGCIWTYSKPVTRTQVIELQLDPGLIVGMLDENPTQQVTAVQVGSESGGWGTMQSPQALSTLDPIATSELIRDLESLRG